MSNKAIEISGEWTSVRADVLLRCALMALPTGAMIPCDAGDPRCVLSGTLGDNTTAWFRKETMADIVSHWSDNLLDGSSGEMGATSGWSTPIEVQGRLPIDAKG